MKPLVAILVAALSLAVGADGHARPRHAYRHHPAAAAVKKVHHAKHRARSRARTTAPRASYRDEIVLSPSLLRQVQRNLADGGYYRGTVDGRLTTRTRRALADFQREYHLDPSGHLDRRTAEALLGRDTVASAATPTRI